MTWEGTPIGPPRPTEVVQVGGLPASSVRAPAVIFGVHNQVGTFDFRGLPSKCWPVKFDFFRPTFTGSTRQRCRPHGPPGAPARRQTRHCRCGFPIGATRGSPRPGRHRAGEPCCIPRIRANEQTRRIHQQPPRRRSGFGASAKSPPQRPEVPRLARTPCPPPRSALQAMPGVAQKEEGQLCTLLQAATSSTHSSLISSMPATGPAMPAVQPSLVVLTTADPPTSKLEPPPPPLFLLQNTTRISKTTRQMRQAGSNSRSSTAMLRWRRPTALRTMGATSGTQPASPCLGLWWGALPGPRTRNIHVNASTSGRVMSCAALRPRSRSRVSPMAPRPRSPPA